MLTPMPQIALLAYDQAEPLIFSIPYTVFTTEVNGEKLFDLHVVSTDPQGVVPTKLGKLQLEPHKGLEYLRTADIIIVPGWSDLDTPPQPAVQEELRQAYQRGAMLVGLCYGAYVLAYSGLLDGKRAVTHWMGEHDFKQRFPKVLLNTNELYVVEGTKASRWKFPLAEERNKESTIAHNTALAEGADGIAATSPASTLASATVAPVAAAADNESTGRVDNSEMNEGILVTSAGLAAGFDCCLFIVRKIYGVKVANNLARVLVLPPHRDGGQAQFIIHSLPVSSSIARLNKVLNHIMEHLEDDYSLDGCAKMAYMSRRSFSRHFAEATGCSFNAWLTQKRLDRSCTLLEDTDLSIDEIALRCGFKSTNAYRMCFKQVYATSPSNYRKTFSS